MPLKPKGVTSGSGKDSPKTEKSELKKSTGKVSSMPSVMAKVSGEGVDCIEINCTKYEWLVV